MFSKFDESYNLEVNFGNVVTVQIKDRGKIYMELKNESKNFIPNML